jgi:hypothetical protein
VTISNKGVPSPQVPWVDVQTGQPTPALLMFLQALGQQVGQSLPANSSKLIVPDQKTILQNGQIISTAPPTYGQGITQAFASNVVLSGASPVTLTGQVNAVTSASAPAQLVPASGAIGYYQKVLNQTNAAVKVHPANGNSIGGSPPGTPHTVPAGGSATFWFTNGYNVHVE